MKEKIKSTILIILALILTFKSCMDIYYHRENAQVSSDINTAASFILYAENNDEYDFYRA